MVYLEHLRQFYTIQQLIMSPPLYRLYHHPLVKVCFPGFQFISPFATPYLFQLGIPFGVHSGGKVTAIPLVGEEEYGMNGVVKLSQREETIRNQKEVLLQPLLCIIQMAVRIMYACNNQYHFFSLFCILFERQ